MGLADVEDLYYKMNNVYKWDALSRTDYFADYQNQYTFCGVMSQRMLFVNVAKLLLKAGEKEKALEMLDKCQQCVPESQFPLEESYLGFSNELMVTEMIDTYFKVGADEKALELAERFAKQEIESTVFYCGFYDYAKDEFETACQIVYYLSDVYKNNGYEDKSEALEKELGERLKEYV